MKFQVCLRYLWLVMLLVASPNVILAADGFIENDKPIILSTMGSFMFGGEVSSFENGDTFHGDHGYAQYYIPKDARNFPLIMWHGLGQSGKTWESTPDGREGYQSIFTRNGWPVYIIDQPRRGRAGYTQTKHDDSAAVPTTAREGGVWNAFRIGEWEPGKSASVYQDVKFPVTGSAIDQFFRQQTPNTGSEPRTNQHREFMANNLASLLHRTGPAILITHSNSGQYGWFSAIRNPEKIKAIVAYEPGQFVFPAETPLKAVPCKNELAADRLQPIFVSEQDFLKLTKMPIIVIYGDNIAKEPSEIFNVDVWRISNTRASEFVNLINKYGGDAVLLNLPETGITGNTHAPFADLNNVQIAKLLQKWLEEKNLSLRDSPHRGPAATNTAQIHIPLEN